MRKLFKELFYVPKYGKVNEKVMLMQVVLSVSIIVMCLAAMSLSAYAFFSYNVTSGSNTITTANFATEVTVQIANENGEPVEVITSDDNSHTAELKANTTYYITLQPTDRSTAKTGFVIITAENCDSKYHTEQLGRDDDGNAKIVTFWIKPNANTKVTFLSCWGTSSYYSHFIQTGENTELYILKNDHVALSVNPTKNNAPPLSNTTGTAPTGTTLPTTEDTTPPAQTIPSETAGTSAPTTATEQSGTTAPSVETDVTETTVIQSSETTAPGSTTEPTVTQSTASTETSGTEETKETLSPTEVTEVTEATDVAATETNKA